MIAEAVIVAAACVVILAALGAVGVVIGAMVVFDRVWAFVAEWESQL